MYAHHWGLVDIPFRSTIDRRWFYEGPTHEEALARLLFLVEQRRRCGLLIGQAGTGKSMLLSVLKRAVHLARSRFVEIDLAGKNSTELVWELAAGLRLDPRDSDSQLKLWRKIEDDLLGGSMSQRQTVLVFDHMDQAVDDCENVITRLGHLNCRTKPWITMIVSLRSDVSTGCGANLTEMVDLSVDVAPLSRDECRDYVISLLGRAGRSTPLFSSTALARIFELSGGVPRQINRICDLSLLAALSTSADAISAEIVSSVADDLKCPTPGPVLAPVDRFA